MTTNLQQGRYTSSTQTALESALQELGHTSFTQTALESALEQEICLRSRSIIGLSLARIHLDSRRFEDAARELDRIPNPVDLGDEKLDCERILLTAKSLAARGSAQEALDLICSAIEEDSTKCRPRFRELKVELELFRAELEAVLGRSQDALARVGALRSLGVVGQDAEISRKIRISEGLVRHSLGDYRGARTCLEHGLTDLLRGQKAPENRILDAAGSCVEILRELGHMKSARQILSLMSVAGDNNSSTVAQIGYLSSLDGKIHTALDTWEAGLETARCDGDVMGQLRLLGSLARAHSRLGNGTYARIHAHQALALAVSKGLPRAHARALDLLSEIRSENGDHVGAVEAIDQARAIKESVSDERGLVATAWVHGRVLRRGGRPGEALRVLEGALGVSRERGYKLQEFKCLLVVIGAFLDLGHQKDANAQLARIEKLALELDLRETHLLNHLAQIATGNLEGRHTGKTDFFQEDERGWLTRFAEQQSVSGPAVPCVKSSSEVRVVSRVEAYLASPHAYDLLVDEATRETWFDGHRAEKITSAPQIHSLLVALMRAGSAGLTKEALVRQLWNLEYDHEIHKTKVHVAILRLRRCLGVKKPGEDRDPIVFDPGHSTYSIGSRFRFFLRGVPLAA